MNPVICSLLITALMLVEGPVNGSFIKDWRGHHAVSFELVPRDSAQLLPVQQITKTLPSSLHKRLDTYPVVGGWQLEIGTYDSMLPVDTAAGILARFYEGIVRRSMVPTAEEHFYRLQSGNLALEFFCRQSPIPWILVRSFARIMGTAARRGFTGKYEMYYTHVQQGITVAISLYVFS